MKDSSAATKTPASRPSNAITWINDVLATKVTLVVGTMWTFYAFMIFGLTPLIWPAYEEQILYWSNFLQLIFLPVISVGTAILGRSTEARAAADHAMIRKEFELLQSTHRELRNQLREIGLNLDELVKRSNG
jgi:hypothetical protein